ncbi:MAG: MFS transporter [Hyphomicrobiales bacterium]|nr:MFS transporter [Hyphomicrobiales bacterium]
MSTQRKRRKSKSIWPPFPAKRKHRASHTSWGMVALLFLIGVSVSLQIGKVPGELPAIETELGLSLFDIGLIVSIFSLIAATGGIFIGAVSDRFGSLRLAVAGLALGGLASFAGSFATSAFPLLVTRVIEGMGFILATTSTPALIANETIASDRGKALGLWGMYMPAGTSLMMLLAALLAGAWDWRQLWQATAFLNLAYATVVWLVFRRRSDSSFGQWPTKPKPMRFRDRLVTALKPGPLLLAGCFMTYAGNFLALIGFLPLMLTRSGEVSASSAGLLTALIVAVNMIGNAASGFLAESKISRSRIIAISAAILGLAAIGVFIDALPFALRYGLALVFSVVGGVIPGTCFGAVESFAASPAKAGPIFGGLIQGAGVGQLIGPSLVAAIVEAIGSWYGAALFIAAGSLLNVVFALLLEKFVVTKPIEGTKPVTAV